MQLPVNYDSGLDAGMLRSLLRLGIEKSGFNNLQRSPALMTKKLISPLEQALAVMIFICAAQG
jgi:hypothetical protein